ncbi:MAG: SCP2 sterol-binding domain-containing protein [Firmicutes bacterium]|nr:SCP2 sterol-binding domain-containing protein [Bacillota bacterium]
MTYEEMFAKASERLCKAKVKGVDEHIAVQFNVSGDGCGSFYAEINEGKINVQPYDYNDNDISVDVSSAELIAALEGKTADTLAFYGNESKIAVLKPVLASIPKARKAAAKPAAKAEKKPAAAKAEKKPAAKKTTKKKAE